MIDLQAYKQELTAELDNILHYWMTHAPDTLNGGFYGSIDRFDLPDAGAPKGLVLHARILWTFSAAFSHSLDQDYLPMAARAYDYLRTHFTDTVYGGLYWSVDAKGQPLNTRKQIYGLAFCLYGYSEWYKATRRAEVLEAAIDLFTLIEEKSFDTLNHGYREAFDHNWQPLADMRLSDKDANEQKTMNTHLHIIEAYANLYRHWPDALLRRRIVQLLEVFDEHMIDKQSGHLLLFFNDQWQVRPDVISYGHDIEAAWLLQQCAEAIDDAHWIERMRQHAVFITKAATEGLDKDGGLWYEFDPSSRQLVKEKHWWPQAEAMLGFYNAWDITNNDTYLQQSVNSWSFIKNYLLDLTRGEWVWGVKEDHSIMEGKDKAGFWKCPYHNARACMELIKRIGNQSH
ncbi:MAG TPA: AGE family epimerase/isomerase [Chitinophagaceae bacterium]|nr:AGE family epimerase/isomerase [Chitinophagaceae bacterium]